MLRSSGILAAVLLAACSSNGFADASKMDGGFMKAMQKAGGKQQSKNLRQARFYKSLLSKAKYVEGDRKLEEGEEDMYGFDITSYSLKYNGCSTIKTFSDEMAQAEGDTVLAAKRFVVFRLCPTNYCSDSSSNGCKKNYGEYVVSMEEYLESMLEFKEQENEEYCRFCEECVEAYEWAHYEDDFQYRDGADNYGQNDDGAADADANGDDAAAAEDQNDDVFNDDAAAGRRRKLEDQEQEQDQQEDQQEDQDNEQQQDCDYYEQCVGYEDVCELEDQQNQNQNNGQQEQEEKVDLREFVECMAIENDDDNGVQYYIGPHCSSDGFTITLGVYSDEFCSVYVGNKVSVADVLGYSIDDDTSALTPTTCTSCLAGSNFWDEVEEQGDDAAQQEDEVTEICEALYDAGAKCHKNLNVDQSNYYSDQQIANQDNVCNFIEAVLSGQYNEDGEIKVVSKSYHSFAFKASDWKNPEMYKNDMLYLEETAAKVTPGRIFLLIVTAGATLAMSIWGCVLANQLKSKNIDWKPRRGKLGESTDIYRQTSGIMSKRSTGSTKLTPLV